MFIARVKCDISIGRSLIMRIVAMASRTPAPKVAPTPLAEARGSYAQCFRRIALVVEFLEIVTWFFNSCIRCSSHAVSLVKFPFQLCIGHWQEHPTAMIKRKKTALYILFRYKLITCQISFNDCPVYTIYNVIFALCFLFFCFRPSTLSNAKSLEFAVQTYRCDR